MPVAMVAPARTSVMGAAAPAGNKPPATVSARPVVIKTVPPAAPVGFASQEHLVAANPGKPLDVNIYDMEPEEAKAVPQTPGPYY
jgi:hypothetical protein